MDKKAAEMAREIYGSFVKGNLYLTDDFERVLQKLVSEKPAV
ncbi:MAG: hypothetical protein Q8P64_27960 [Deltaproteobacteria bacterium]|nr:hypothetical protein [Deltaproteobacteria bacterium]